MSTDRNGRWPLSVAFCCVLVGGYSAASAEIHVSSTRIVVNGDSSRKGVHPVFVTNTALFR
jgi:hypothetical protein